MGGGKNQLLIIIKALTLSFDLKLFQVDRLNNYNTPIQPKMEFKFKCLVTD